MWSHADYVQVSSPVVRNRAQSPSTRVSALFFLSYKRPVSGEVASQRNICNVILRVKMYSKLSAFQTHRRLRLRRRIHNYCIYILLHIMIFNKINEKFVALTCLYLCKLLQRMKGIDQTSWRKPLYGTLRLRLPTILLSTIRFQAASLKTSPE